MIGVATQRIVARVATAQLWFAKGLVAAEVSSASTVVQGAT